MAQQYTKGSPAPQAVRCQGIIVTIQGPIPLRQCFKASQGYSSERCYQCANRSDAGPRDAFLVSIMVPNFRAKLRAVEANKPKSTVRKDRSKARAQKATEGIKPWEPKRPRGPVPKPKVVEPEPVTVDPKFVARLDAIKANRERRKARQQRKSPTIEREEK